MLLPSVAFILAILIVVILYIAVLVIAKKKRQSIIFQGIWFCVCIAIIWPISDLTFYILYKSNTHAGTATSIEEVTSIEKYAIESCSDITYYYDPKEIWYVCTMSLENFSSFKEKLQVRESESAECLMESPIVAQIMIDKSFTKFASKMAGNGAQSIVAYNNQSKKLLFCRWFW